MNALRWSQPAPEFSLPSTLGRPVSLAEYRGKADVVLAFYCYDWGGIWTPELTGLGQVARELEGRGIAFLAISGDSPFSHEAFTKARSFPFPLLSDIHRQVIQAYGVHDVERNVAYRSTFIVDRDGLLRWGQAGDRHMVRDGQEVVRVLGVIDELRRKAWRRAALAQLPFAGLRPTLVPFVMMSGAANGMSTLAAPARSRRSSGRATTGPIDDAVALGANGARAVGPVAASLLVVAFGSYERVFWLLTDPSA